ncbi:universal stress protein [Halegenticoccus soli]|uniref:universal stress protein n=1 Tax=Halegenticoccus soli TaxID=1985678 RepID=UPI000C6E47EE|nr:universal stress protein [Halegenticoccus soli]
MYANVLIPIDGSEGARRGVEHALALGERYGARIHALYVVDESVYGGTAALSSEELSLERIERRGEELLEEIERRAADRGLEANCACVRGTPHRAILSYAADNEVDLIVMGKHGRSAHGPPHLGSTTDRVLRLADVPVLPV